MKTFALIAALLMAGTSEAFKVSDHPGVCLAEGQKGGKTKPEPTPEPTPDPTPEPTPQPTYKASAWFGSNFRSATNTVLGAEAVDGYPIVLIHYTAKW